MDIAVYDRIRGGYRVFIGDLGPRIGKYEIEKEFKQYGPITDTWVARNPPGFAFLVFKYAEDAESAVKKLHGRHVCGRRIRVEHARPFEERRRLQMEERRGSYRRRYSRSKDRRSRSRDRKRSRSHSRSRKSKKSKRSRTRSRSGSRKRRDSRKSGSADRKSKSVSPKRENGDATRDKSKSRSRERSSERKKSELEDTDMKIERRSPSEAKSEDEIQTSVVDDIENGVKDGGNESD